MADGMSRLATQTGEGAQEMTPRRGAKADELLFLDDHPANIAAAKELGWHTHLFTTPELARQDLVRRALLPA